MPSSHTEKDTLTYSVSLVTQGRHKFYTLSMPSDVLAECCTVDTRIDNPIEGFQRKLDPRRADDIARYIDEGMGTIPSSIVLSAQADAQLKYTRARRSITFKKTPKSFLIIDGQHRVFGFAKAKSTLRVPVVIYNSLTRAEECKLFIDINTTQRPVPNELLLDIKRLAETETTDEAILTDVFDLFTSESDSPPARADVACTEIQGKALARDVQRGDEWRVACLRWCRCEGGVPCSFGLRVGLDGIFEAAQWRGLDHKSNAVQGYFVGIPGCCTASHRPLRTRLLSQELSRRA